MSCRRNREMIKAFKKHVKGNDMVWFSVIWGFTLTESSTDCASTSTAMPRLKKGCWVMSYILARKPPFSARMIEDQTFIDTCTTGTKCPPGKCLFQHFHTVRVALSHQVSYQIWMFELSVAEVLTSLIMLESVVASCSVLQVALMDYLGVLISVTPSAQCIKLRVLHILMQVCGSVCLDRLIKNNANSSKLP